MKLDIRETSACLAGLRLLQQALYVGNVPSSIETIRSDDRSFLPLDSKQIDALCERLNGVTDEQD